MKARLTCQRPIGKVTKWLLPLCGSSRTKPAVLCRSMKPQKAAHCCMRSTQSHFCLNFWFFLFFFSLSSRRWCWFNQFPIHLAQKTRVPLKIRTQPKEVVLRNQNPFALQLIVVVVVDPSRSPLSNPNSKKSKTEEMSEYCSCDLYVIQNRRLKTEDCRPKTKTK